jgi:hypothetical protein
LHARTARIQGIAQAMNHTTADDFKQVRLTIRIWPCCGDNAVDLFRIERSESREKRQEHVHMRKPMFLKLNAMNMCKHIANYFALCQIINKGGLI